MKGYITPRPYVKDPQTGIAPLLTRRFNMSESTARRWMKRCDDRDHEQGEDR
jgi:hypothetical protein